MDYEITEKELDPQLALTHRAPVTMATIGDGIGAAFGVLMEHAARTGAQWAGPPFVLYPEVCDGEFEITVCMPVVARRRRRRARRRGGGAGRRRSRPRCTWAPTARSARRTPRCRSG